MTHCRRISRYGLSASCRRCVAGQQGKCIAKRDHRGHHTGRPYHSASLSPHTPILRKHIIDDDPDTRWAVCAISNRRLSRCGAARVMSRRGGEGARVALYDNDKRLWIPWIGSWYQHNQCMFLRREPFAMWEMWQLKLRHVPKKRCRQV